MTNKQKRAIYYSVRDRKIKQLKMIIAEFGLVNEYETFKKYYFKKYCYEISRLKAFIRLAKINEVI